MPTGQSVSQTIFNTYAPSHHIAQCTYTCTCTSTTGSSWTVIIIHVCHVAECGGTFTGTNGTLRSPFFPLNAPHNRDCEYIITQPDDAIITLQFVTFGVETSYDGNCQHDYLLVHDPKYARLFSLNLTSFLSFKGPRRIHSERNPDRATLRRLPSCTNRVARQQFVLEVPHGRECRLGRVPTALLPQ